MSDEISLLPTMLEREITGYRIVTPPKSKWYEYETFSHEGGVVELTLQYRGGMVVHVEFPVTGSDAPQQFLTTGDVTFNLYIDDDYYDIHTTVPFTVHVYERWMKDMFLVSTTKFLYDYEEEFHLSDIHLGGHPNVIGTPNIYPTSGWTSNIEEGTQIVEPTNIEVYYTETTRDGNFNPVYVNYTLYYTVKVADRIDAISVTDLRFEPHEAPMWDKAQFFEYYNDGRVVKTAQYGDWDSYSPTTSIDYATLVGSYANREASAIYGDKEWRGTMVCNANDYHLTDDTHVYNLHSTLDNYQNSVEIDAPWVRNMNSISYNNNEYLKKLTLGSMLWMNTGSFTGCTKLEELHIPKCTNLYIPFNGCTKLKVIDAPNLEVIGDDVFNGCTAQKDVILPKCWSIGSRAFRNNYIGKLSLPSIEDLGEAVFVGADVSISDMYLGALDTIPTSTFNGAHIRGSDVSLPNVTSIGNNAFQNAYGYVSLDFPNIESIGSYAFQFDEHQGGKHLITLSPSTYANVKTIGAHAFDFFVRSSELDLHNCIDVGEDAFSKCTSLTKVDLSSCTAIHTGAFEECKNLVEVKILTPRCTLGYWVFEYEDGETYARCNPNLKVWVQNRYKQDYKTDSSMGWVSLASHIHGIGEGVVTLDDDTITRIGEYEWSYLNDLKHVSLNNCTEVEAYGFYEDPNMETVYLPNVVSIGERAFSIEVSRPSSIPSSHYTGDLRLDNCVEIGESAFAWFMPSYDGIEAYQSKHFTNLYAQKLRTIGDYGMLGCRFSGTYDLSNLMEIGKWAFYGSQFMGSLNLPKAVTIGREAFRYSYGYTSINVPNCTSLGRSCFNEQNTVTYVDCHNVEELGDYCLAGMTRLHEITLDKPMCTCGQGCLNNVASDFKVYVNDEDYDWYVSNWRSEYVGYITKKSERTTE